MGKYFTSGGNSIEEGGIAPDIFIDLDLNAQEDLQLNKALEEAKKAIN
jgi:C-terminal processing protease CtpA/Prc